jgi:hypothetical protein
MNCFILSRESYVSFVSASLMFHRKKQDIFYWVRSVAYRSEDSGKVFGKIHVEERKQFIYSRQCEYIEKKQIIQSYGTCICVSDSKI